MLLKVGRIEPRYNRSRRARVGDEDIYGRVRPGRSPIAVHATGLQPAGVVEPVHFDFRASQRREPYRPKPPPVPDRLAEIVADAAARLEAAGEASRPKPSRPPPHGSINDYLTLILPWALRVAAADYLAGRERS